MGAVMARAVVRHDNRTRRGDNDRSGSRHDNRSGHDWGGCDDNWCRLRHDNGLRHDWRGLRHYDRCRLGDNRRLRIDNNRSGLSDNRRLRYDGGLCDYAGLRIDNDSRWRLDGFRDVGDGVHDVKHRIEAAVVEGSAVMVMGLGLEAVACQHNSGDGQTDDGVTCVFHDVLLFVGWFVYCFAFVFCLHQTNITGFCFFLIFVYFF